MKMKSIAFALAAVLGVASLFAQDRAAGPARGAARGTRGAPPGPKTTGDYASDVVVVRDAQGQALEQAQGMQENSESARAQAAADAAVKEMERALAALEAASNSPAKLPEALAAEQAAYQALLKASAREYQVSQSRSRGQRSGSSAGQPNQRQLDQLDLNQEQNRYENQRQATPQQSPQQREQLTVQNRLKELAQRQQDLNQRLKELQTALQEAKTEAERQDVRNELKRLRDEQRDLLADVDELGQRMDRPENQSSMSDARQQLDQTRSQVQQAAEALDKEAVPQALTAGTRAERDLEQLRDDFRKQNSNQFSEEMRSMRDEARQLAQREEEIRKGIEERADPQRKALSDAGKTDALVNQIQQQRSTLTNLLTQMRDVSERAESPEPLLSKQLYDTLRKNAQTNTESALTMAGDLVKYSFVEQAVPVEQRVRQQIDDLKQGVEKAAESVLGDGTESLRLAKRELDDLAQQLDQEIARATGQTNQSSDAAASASERLAGGDRTNRLAFAGTQGERTNSASGRAGNPSDSSERSTQAGRSGQPSDQQANAEGGNQGDGRQGQPGQRGQRAGGRRGDQPGELAKNGQDQEQNSDSNGSAQGGNRSGQGRSGQRGRNGGQPGDSELAQSQRDGADTAATGGQRQGGARNAGGARGGGNFWDQGGAYAGGWNGGWYGPFTGTNYMDWYDRLGNVEEMVDVPDLQTELARIRDRARVIRTDIRRTGAEPRWPLVQMQIAGPLVEVRKRVAEELARRESSEALVPIDRDPVPSRYSELVRRYYEKLGAGE